MCVCFAPIILRCDAAVVLYYIFMTGRMMNVSVGMYQILYVPPPVRGNSLNPIIGINNYGGFRRRRAANVPRFPVETHDIA